MFPIRLLQPLLVVYASAKSRVFFHCKTDYYKLLALDYQGIPLLCTDDDLFEKCVTKELLSRVMSKHDTYK